MGTGYSTAQQFQAAHLQNPRLFVAGSIAAAYEHYPHMGPILAALGYSPEQKQELSETINASNVELILDATPAGLAHVVQTLIPIVRVQYEFQQASGKPLSKTIADFIRD